jgi:hypothetical protein
MSFYSPKPPDTRNKKNSEIAHAQKRSQERLGEGIDTKMLARRIKSGDSLFLSRQSHRISHHELLVGEKRVRCVYDNKRKVVVTVWAIEETK